MNDDLQLLRDYADRGSEAAFRTLVERHLPMVMGVARRATRDVALSEEIAQTAFLLLAQKAASLGRGVILSGWLYRTTAFVAARAVRSEMRRVRREQEALSMPLNQLSHDDWPKVRETLDQALLELAESDRNAIILRFWEARSFREVGEQLGVAEEAAKKRVMRAVEKLRGRLAKSGIEVGTAALMVGLSREQAEAMVPDGLGGRTITNVLERRWSPRAAGWGLGGWAGFLTSSAPSWGLRIAGLAGACGVMIAAWWAVQALERSRPAGTETKLVENSDQEFSRSGRTLAEASSPSPGAEVATANASTTPLGLRLKVVEREGEVPIPGAEVSHTGQLVPIPTVELRPLRTDPDGWIQIEVPSGFMTEPGLDRLHQFQAWVRTPGFAPREVMWLSTTGHVVRTMTNDYVVRLDRGIRAGGVVVDDQGQPVANAVIGVIGSDYRGYSVSYDSTGEVITPPEVRAEDFPSYSLPSDPRARGAVLTDRQGRFVLEHFPEDLGSMILEVIAVDGSRRRFDSGGSRAMTAEKLTRFDIRALRDGAARLEVPRAIPIAGRVVDREGQPVIDARVFVGMQVGNLQILARTNVDVQGEFRVVVGEEREVILTASAPGFATTSTLVWAGRPAAEARLIMNPERPLHGQVVDEVGQPIVGAKISWVDSGRQGHALEWTAISDSGGRFIWESAPEGELRFFVTAEGNRRRLAVLTAGEREQVINLGQGPEGVARVTGTVLDAETGEPIPQFRVAFAWQDPVESATGKFRELDGFEGHFEAQVRASDSLVGSWPGYVVIVTATHHEPFVSRWFALEEGDQPLTIRMAKGGVVAGVVRTQEGEPAVGAQLVVAQPAKPVFTRRPGEIRKADAQSDERGAFEMTKPPGGRGLLIVHQSGYYVAPIAGDTAHLEIRLRPWAKLKGVLRAWGGRVAGQRICVEPADTYNELGIYLGTIVETDDQGAFEFSKLPAGEVRVGHQPEFVMRSGLPTVVQLETTVALRGGETSEVELGGTGRSVMANLRSGTAKPDCSITNSIVTLRRGTEVKEFDPWKFNTRQSQERAHRDFERRNAAAQRTFRSHLAIPDAEGRVSFAEVEPGRYTLEACMPRSGDSVGPQGWAKVLRVDVEVTDLGGDDVGSGPLNLGDFEVTLP